MEICQLCLRSRITNNFWAMPTGTIYAQSIGKEEITICPDCLKKQFEKGGADDNPLSAV